MEFLVWLPWTTDEIGTCKTGRTVVVSLIATATPAGLVALAVVLAEAT